MTGKREDVDHCARQRPVRAVLVEHRAARIADGCLGLVATGGRGPGRIRRVIERRVVPGGRMTVLVGDRDGPSDLVLPPADCLPAVIGNG